MIAAVLVAAVVFGVVTPACAMPACENATTTACSDFQPACEECPDAIVMKHVADDATSVEPFVLVVPAVMAAALELPSPPASAPALAVPAGTAAPPSLDPLGVRLSV